MSKRRKCFYAVAAAIVVALLLCLGTGWYMVGYALTPEQNRTDTAMFYKRMADEYPWLRQRKDSLRQADALRDTFIVTPSGERHHALYVRNPRAEGRTALLVHGYKDCSIRMLPIGSVYERLGYNLLLPDLHGHGLSDGADIQMGWKDRLDIIRWIGVAEKMFSRAEEPDKIVLHGVSMGAATVMCVAGERLPHSVGRIVEDCGYTSVWDEFSHQLHEQFGLPDFPVLYAADIVCRLRNGWGFREASPLNQLRKNSRPTLFIHGTSDDYVPSAMVLPLYNASMTYTNPKTNKRCFNGIWLTPGTIHARSYHDYPDEYAAKVADFVSPQNGQ